MKPSLASYVAARIKPALRGRSWNLVRFLQISLVLAAINCRIRISGSLQKFNPAASAR
jgi:hypothetical protein